MSARPRVGWPIVAGLLIAGLGGGAAATAGEPAEPARRSGADAADEAGFHFRRGARLYAQGKVEEALAAFYASYRRVPNHNVLFNIARCLEDLNLPEEAFRAWSEFAGHAEIDPDDRTDVRAALERLCPRLALVLVTSDPPGADIFAQREDLGSLGQTPKLLALPPGPAHLILKREGQVPVSQDVVLARGQTEVVRAQLRPVVGRVDIIGAPAEATVGLRGGGHEGRTLRRGPGAIALPPGTHLLEVAQAGYETLRIPIEVIADQVTTVDARLAPVPPATASLVVRSNVVGALVRVDGHEAGFTPTVLEAVPAGSRTVEVSAEGRVTYRAQVVLADGERRSLDARLPRPAAQVGAATGEVTAVADAPASVTVIPSEELAALGASTLSEAVRTTRGVYTSDDRGYEAVGLRGGSPAGDDSNRVLVLVDGHATNDVTTGQGFVGHDLDVDLGDVERIEVVRGAGSVLFGTGALLGVLNVVTRSPAPGVTAGASAELGAPDRRGGRVVAGYGRGTTAVRARVSFLDDSGTALLPGDGGDVAEAADGERAEHADLSARAGEVTVRGSFNRRRKNLPTGVYDTRLEPGTTFDDRRGWAEATLRHPARAGSWSARAAVDYARFDGHYRNRPEGDGTAVGDSFDGNQAIWLTGEGRFSAREHGGHRFAGGVLVQRQGDLHVWALGPDGEQTLDTHASELLFSASFGDTWTIGPRWQVHAAARLDDYQRSVGATASPRVAAITRPYAGGTSKLMLGRAFRAPSTYERFYEDGGLTQKAATTLGQETLLAAEAEHTHVAGEGLTFVAGAFAHRIDGLVVLCMDESDGLLVYRNASGHEELTGANAEARWESDGGAVAALSLAAQRSSRLDACGEAQPIVGPPGALAAARLYWPIVPGVQVGGEAVFDGGRKLRDGRLTEPAVAAALALNGSVPRSQLRYFLRLDNILDDRTGYPVGEEFDRLTVPRRGRALRAGLSWTY